MLWLLSVLVGAIAGAVAARIVGSFGPLSWGIGFFVMWTTGYPWMRKHGQTTRPFWLHTLIGAGSTVAVFGVILLLWG